MVLLILFYWLVMFVVTRDFNHSIEQFITFKYWVIALVLGFGIQTGLFWHIRKKMKSNNSTKGSIALSASSSTIAMVACCTHHLVDILPILGLSAAALFLSSYQTYFFMLGIISNILGIVWMLYLLKNKKYISLKNIKNKQ